MHIIHCGLPVPAGSATRSWCGDGPPRLGLEWTSYFPGLPVESSTATPAPDTNMSGYRPPLSLHKRSLFGAPTPGTAISQSAFMASNFPPLFKNTRTTEPSPRGETTTTSGRPSPSMSPKSAATASHANAATSTFFCEMRNSGSGASGGIRPQPTWRPTSMPGSTISAGVPEPWPPRIMSAFMPCSLRRLASVSGRWPPRCRRSPIRLGP